MGYLGVAVCTTLHDVEGSRVRVDKADPFIMISTAMLAAPGLDVDGDIVKFGDINPVTYRIINRYDLYVEAERIA